MEIQAKNIDNIPYILAGLCVTKGAWNTDDSKEETDGTHKC